jgi:hypothetical protein
VDKLVFYRKERKEDTQRTQRIKLNNTAPIGSLPSVFLAKMLDFSRNFNAFVLLYRG